MKLSEDQKQLLKKLMIQSAKKGNLANSGLVMEDGKTIASAESLVATNNDATAHSERMLVEKVGKLKGNNYTPGLSMVTVIEPCLMCMSAASQAGYKELGYIIPAEKYIKKIPWMSDIEGFDKHGLAAKFSGPFDLIHLSEYEAEFCEVFEELMADLLK